ncbi:multidrug MFS transporter [Leuconostoc citreum]|uniref:glycosyltransferase n=1 Tax=Leuconostoc citreum TaxID=33964 RepID=UPI0021A90C11|nr:glycosyltransferase [Leuconostoc citreum]MCT3075008.1 multidrug MFS transporter [Leuconostoc citreum]
MIFVTVGTHEQQFDRLVKAVDDLVKNKVINEQVLIQIGYSNYIPKFVKYRRFLSYSEMETSIKNARLVITHGGPASFLNVLSKGKKPIVVPRMSSFGEHINNHQLIFARYLIKNHYDITLIENIEELEKKVLLFKSDNAVYHSHNNQFVSKFIEVIQQLSN